MAKDDNKLKITSCPICGYTDSATDPEALYSAIEEHVRMAHNMDLNTLNADTEIKTTGEVETDAAGVPAGVFATRLPGPGPTGQGPA